MPRKREMRAIYHRLLLWYAVCNTLGGILLSRMGFYFSFCFAIDILCIKCFREPPNHWQMKSRNDRDPWRFWVVFRVCEWVRYQLAAAMGQMASKDSARSRHQGSVARYQTVSQWVEVEVMKGVPKRFCSNLLGCLLKSPGFSHHVIVSYRAWGIPRVLYRNCVAELFSSQKTFCLQLLILLNIIWIHPLKCSHAKEIGVGRWHCL